MIKDTGLWQLNSKMLAHKVEYNLNEALAQDVVEV